MQKIYSRKITILLSLITFLSFNLCAVSFNINHYQQSLAPLYEEEILDPLALKVEPLYKNRLSNILLIIHFNHPYYANIGFIKKLYSAFFSNIVFYGEQPHPEVITIKTHTGYLHSPVIKDVLTRYPYYDGYLFLEDDCILNIWNCLNLDFNKLWLPALSGNPKVVNYKNGFQVTNFSTGANANIWWWPTPWGLAPTKRAFAQLSAQDMAILEKNVGPDIAVGTAADMFYIPGKFRDDALRLSIIFNNVFVEIAIPCIFCCLDSRENWEKTGILWGQTIPTSSPWPRNFTCIHPVKLSNAANQAYIVNQFKTILNQ